MFEVTFCLQARNAHGHYQPEVFRIECLNPDRAYEMASKELEMKMERTFHLYQVVDFRIERK